MLRRLVIAALLLAGCTLDDGLSFKQCDSISDSFLKLYPDYEGCNLSEDYLFQFAKKNKLSIETRSGPTNALGQISSKVRAHIEEPTKIYKSHMIYGIMDHKNRRQHNYLALVTNKGEIISILPAYSHW